MTGAQMWAAYTAGHPEAAGADYDAWAFGDDPDGLAALVLAGVKTATASAYPVYEREDEPLPEAGEYSVILNSREEAVCVIRTDRVFTVPFREVDGEQARREGEGDRSLAYWRAVHERFFREEMAASGLVFTEDMPVVCEQFHMVWPEKGAWDRKCRLNG